MKAIITVGLGFGDEGKGATVDYLTRGLGAGLVVRYSGGAQAGHNVELPDGRRHTFAQFGAGTLAGAATFLGPRMIISPAALNPEADHLRQQGVNDPFSLLTVHAECLVATAYHVAMNRLRESARGSDRHGSCGLGIGESRKYWLQYGQDAIVASDLLDPVGLRYKLSLLRDRLLIEMQSLPQLHPEWAAMLYDLRPGSEAEHLLRDVAELQISRRMPRAETVIFEAAQGVLLDEYKGFHPYTTWSTVTPLHALEILDDFPQAEATVLGITRAYSTRHGAGPFPSYCANMTAGMIDQGNPHNAWQGSIRFGPLDLVLLDYAARIANVDGVVVNGLDELPERTRVVTRYLGCRRLNAPHSMADQEQLTQRLSAAKVVCQEVTPPEILDLIAKVAPVRGVSYGPSHADRLGFESLLTEAASI